MEEAVTNFSQFMEEPESAGPIAYDDSELTEMSKEELLATIQQLRSEVATLRRIHHRDSANDEAGQNAQKAQRKSKKQRTQRPFDFSRYNTRHVALRIAYLGWDYQGFASQENTEQTIEAELFEALMKTRLIQSRETANYSRCGRTDKGVSAFGQVIAIDLRSNLLEGLGVIQTPGGKAQERPGDKTQEIEYTHILNRVLPESIRVLAWTPVHPSFNARFSTLHRTYKYFFPRGDLDIKKMQEAAHKLVGDHDFRNFCKMDVGNGVVNFWRTIISVDITLLDDGESGYQMHELTVTGQAFLYHQVRCMTAILLLIGQHKEKPEIIDRFLNIKEQPCKPQYSMASEYPLVLYDCAYKDIQWIYEKGDQNHNIARLQCMWTQQVVRAVTLKRMLDGLNMAPVPAQQTDPTEDTSSKEVQTALPWHVVHPSITNQATFLLLGTASKSHKPLLDRPVCESLEDRIKHFAKKRRVESSD